MKFRLPLREIFLLMGVLGLIFSAANNFVLTTQISEHFGSELPFPWSFIQLLMVAIVILSPLTYGYLGRKFVRTND